MSSERHGVKRDGRVGRDARRRSGLVVRRSFRWVLGILIVCLGLPQPRCAYGSDDIPLSETGPQLIRQFCFDCHGDGAEEGQLTLDGVENADRDGDPNKWWKVLKNLRSGVMPPPGEAIPDAQQQEAIANWIKYQVFDIDPQDPDPGRLPVRRLNRTEYENTINDLMGTRMDATLLFPADDSGHGFDNVGDALSFSPLLMEKYLDAARMIVAESVPQQTWIVPLQVFRNRDFQNPEGRSAGRDVDGKQSHDLRCQMELQQSGDYEVEAVVKLHGSFEFDSARYNVQFLIDGKLQFEQECGWDENKRLEFPLNQSLEAGQHELQFVIRPVPVDESEEVVGGNGTFVRFEIASIRVQGPTGTEQLVHPRNYERFFHRDQPPADVAGRRQYAGEVLERFATRAYRSRVPEETVQRLVSLAEAGWSKPDATFEQGIGEALVAVLTSPRFLFHLEAEPAAVASDQDSILVDEMVLASRLSYFLWSTMPDQELMELASEGQLRNQLSEQVQRMLADGRSQQLLRNFVGQWLKTRDVIQKDVDPLEILGAREEYDQMLDDFRKRFFRRGRGRDAGELSEEDQKARDRFQQLRGILDGFDEGLKRSMQRETEMCVDYILREDRSLLDLLDSDYTFLNEKLARHYGIPDVQGDHMRRVTLPADSPRGGILTHGSMLLVTANPTRTSPVKRGLFVLENVLGTPAPPAPPGVPELEASADRFDGRQPSLRELLAVHRESALCSSCHSRMDPIGLALENFNALGQWRTEDQGQAIDPAGQLISGESFADVKQLKAILRQNHATEFYRCLTEKMLTYALGRGVEYYDQHTIDQIVEQLEANDGRMSTLIQAVVQSTAFQKQRTQWTEDVATRPGNVEPENRGEQ